MGSDIINLAPVRETVRLRPSANAGAQVSSRRYSRSRNGTLLSIAITAVTVSVGFSAITHLILAAILNPAAPSKASDRWSVTTSSIAAAPLPEKGETIVRKTVIAFAELLPETQSAAMQSAEQRPKALLATHRERGETIVPKKAIAPANLPPEKQQEETAELDQLAEVLQTEPHDAKAANDRAADVQQRPEQKQLAAVGPKHGLTDAEQPQTELTESVPTPKPRPPKFAARESNAPTRSARVRTDVNMRAGPRNNAAVITAVRAGREIKVINGCKQWCEVMFNGKRGWIYKRFVREPAS